jgi:flagellar motor component MotA
MLIFAGVLITAVAFLFATIGTDYLYGFYINLNNVSNYYNIASLLCVLVPLLLFLILTNNGRIIKIYIMSSMKKEHRFDKDELQTIAGAAKSTGRFALGTGAFFCLANILTMLSYMNFEDEFGASRLVYDIAMTLISLLYAIAIAFFIFYPLQVWAENKLRELTKDD